MHHYQPLANTPILSVGWTFTFTTHSGTAFSSRLIASHVSAPPTPFESLEKSNPPTARIASKDLLKIFPESDAHRADAARAAERGMLELPLQAYLEYVELATRNQKRMESMWGQWQAKSRMRLRFGARAH